MPFDNLKLLKHLNPVKEASQMSSFDPALIERNKAAIKQASPLLDQISKTWENIEKFFQSQGILRGACTGYQTIYQDPYGECPIGEHLLGIQKLKGAWRICVGMEHYNHPEDEFNWKPIGEASTQLRIELLEHVHSLFAAMVKSNEDYIKDIEEAAKKSQKVLSELQIADL